MGQIITKKKVSNDDFSNQDANNTIDTSSVNNDEWKFVSNDDMITSEMKSSVEIIDLAIKSNDDEGIIHIDSDEDTDNIEEYSHTTTTTTTTTTNKTINESKNQIVLIEDIALLNNQSVPLAQQELSFTSDINSPVKCEKLFDKLNINDSMEEVNEEELSVNGKENQVKQLNLVEEKIYQEDIEEQEEVGNEKFEKFENNELQIIQDNIIAEGDKEERVEEFFKKEEINEEALSNENSESNQKEDDTKGIIQVDNSGEEFIKNEDEEFNELNLKTKEKKDEVIQEKEFNGKEIDDCKKEVKEIIQMIKVEEQEEKKEVIDELKLVQETPLEDLDIKSEDSEQVAVELIQTNSDLALNDNERELEQVTYEKVENEIINELIKEQVNEVPEVESNENLIEQNTSSNSSSSSNSINDECLIPISENSEIEIQEESLINEYNETLNEESTATKDFSFVRILNEIAHTNLIECKFEFDVELNGLNVNDIKEIKLTGSFKNWSDFYEMSHDELRPNIWYKTIYLAPHLDYEYKYIINGIEWKCDNGKPIRGQNNFIIVP